MLAVTFHQNDNIRKSAIQLPLVVDILQGEGRYEVSPQICNFVRFFGVRIVLGLVSGQIELDDGLPNTIFHVGLLAQVEATGNPPVFLAAVGCSTLDGDKGGNFEILKIILRNLCNFIDDVEGLGGHALVVALAVDGHLAALLRRGVGIVAVGEVLILHQGRVAVLDHGRGIDGMPCIVLRRDVGNHAGGHGLGRDLGSVVVGDVHQIVRVDKLDAYPQSARILDLWYVVAEAVSLICGVARDAPALGHLSVIHNDRLVLLAVIFPFVGTCNSAKLVLQLIRDGKMHRGNGKRCAVCAGLVGGSFPHTGDDGVFRARLQVGEMAAALPGRPIVYGILPGIVFCYFNVRTRPGNHLDDRNVPLIHMAAAAGEVKRFVLGHLTFKHPLVFFVFQLELNRGSEVIRVIPIWAMRAACVLVELSHIDIWLDRDKNSPDVPFLRNLSSGKTVRQLPILLGFVGLCADAGDQIVWNCDVCQIRCQIKCWRGFLRQCRRWEQRQHHAAEQQDAEKSFSHGLVPPFSL